MIEPTTSLTTAIEKASNVANSSLFTTVIDKITGFKISQWVAEGEVRKKIILDEYEKAKENGVSGVQYIENLRHTANLIDTAVKSSKYIEQNKPNEIKIDNDFFWNTLEHAKTVSNEYVQELIAKIVAGEYNTPGTYSISTLQTLKVLGRSDLELFEKIGSLCLSRKLIPSEVFSENRDQAIRDIQKSLGIRFSSFQTLLGLGLILPSPMIRTVPNPGKRIFFVTYFDKKIKYRAIDESPPAVKIPKYWLLSNNGLQIIQHLKPQYIGEYHSWLKTNFKIKGYQVIDE